METLKKYIEERIETLELAYKINPVSFHEGALNEIKAILSKIEEIEEEERIQNIGEARAEDKW